MSQSYIITNISKYDISIYDLGVRISKGRTIDLLDTVYKLEIDAIRRSRSSGVLGIKIAKGQIVEVNTSLVLITEV